MQARGQDGFAVLSPAFRELCEIARVESGKHQPNNVGQLAAPREVPVSFHRDCEVEWA
jgi:hypothetical protein